MKFLSKLRYFAAVLLVLISVSGIISPTRGSGQMTLMEEPGRVHILETR